MAKSNKSSKPAASKSSKPASKPAPVEERGGFVPVQTIGVVKLADGGTLEVTLGEHAGQNDLALYMRRINAKGFSKGYIRLGSPEDCGSAAAMLGRGAEAFGAMLAPPALRKRASKAA